MSVSHKANLNSALKRTQGPRGLDKILISPDGDITVTNDGATILSEVEDALYSDVKVTR
jgi:chaperonin GroEL (HSP60 family)